MKVILLFAVCCLVLMTSAVSGEESSPVNLSGNNIKNIVTVGLDANAVISNQVERNIVNVLLALLNQQAVVVADGKDV
jgi:hypothetical protein